MIICDARVDVDGKAMGTQVSVLMMVLVLILISVLV